MNCKIVFSVDRVVAKKGQNCTNAQSALQIIYLRVY